MGELNRSSAAGTSSSAPRHTTSVVALSGLEQEILEFERVWWRFAGTKEQAVRARFDLSMIRYYQVLSATIDKPAAYAQAPMMVKKLRDQRASSSTTEHRDESPLPVSSDPADGRRPNAE